jgi:hypothetical protein
VSSLPRLSGRIVWLTRRLPAPPARTKRTHRAAARPSPSTASGLRAIPQAPTLQPKPATRPAAARATDTDAPTPTAGVPAATPDRTDNRAPAPCERQSQQQPESWAPRQRRSSALTARRVPCGSTAKEAHERQLAPPHPPQGRRNARGELAALWQGRATAHNRPAAAPGDGRAAARSKRAGRGRHPKPGYQ